MHSPYLMVDAVGIRFTKGVYATTWSILGGQLIQHVCWECEDVTARDNISEGWDVTSLYRRKHRYWEMEDVSERDEIEEG